MFDHHQKYRFDCYRPGEPRWQWIHKEEEEFHGFSDVRSYSIPVTPICANDFAEVSITMMSLMGSLQIDSFKWNPLVVESIPQQDAIRNYNRS